MSLLNILSAYDEKDDTDDIGDIIDNLNNILNSKQGYSYFLQNFGIPDYNHISSREIIAQAVIHDVRENIENFEPRVKLLDIVELNDDALFRLSFRIDCVVRKNARSLSMYLDPLQERYHVSSI
ncbi:hypothetical protein F6R98_00370 [Candidatus Methylospira mobilis]|uniref:IraD/Gp25-like domain-containing protein n=1 Tax=Candidatus Methylospira mobilis TaxID=1808979 RepID=A0A5Q0BBF6_9GAMM|nr:GPW/gp25 family protein [Candidatus Methylospira mobilis]QFY41255.1 hypothetical protein F6R98_00370 [Candidatus Methylospira mobilis]WNV05523.1 GPW/gp25 family protein [Candidatus Methylospira mobilis]